jgi:hypothetical protein
MSRHVTPLKKNRLEVSGDTEILREQKNSNCVSLLLDYLWHYFLACRRRHRLFSIYEFLRITDTDFYSDSIIKLVSRWYTCIILLRHYRRKY